MTTQPQTQEEETADPEPQKAEAEAEAQDQETEANGTADTADDLKAQMETQEPAAFDAEEEEAAAKAEAQPLNSNRWQCPKCNLFNDVQRWQCLACYAPMKTLQPAKTYRQWKKNQKRGKKKTETPGDESPSPAKMDTDIKETEVAASDEEVVAEVAVLPGILIPKVMRALVKTQPGKGFEFVDDYEVPEPGEGEVLVRAFATSICGSDAILYKWTAAAEVIAKTPFIPGHECAGLVVKAGPNTRFECRVGQRVAIENHFFCGECYQCQNRRGDICANMSQFGHGKGTQYGGCAEYFVCKDKYCFPVKSNISWRDAALLEPLGVAVNACTNAEIVDHSDETLLIIGCGTIGCMAAAVARAMGCKRVIACDIVGWKLEKATVMGATEVFNSRECNFKDKVLELTDGVGVGRLIECSGNAAMVNQCFACVRKGGNVVLVGLPKNPLHVENVLTDIIFKSIQIRSIHGRRIFRDWYRAERYLSRGKIDLDPLVTQSGIALSDFETAYEQLFSGKAMKVVFNPTRT